MGVIMIANQRKRAIEMDFLISTCLVVTLIFAQLACHNLDTKQDVGGIVATDVDLPVSRAENVERATAQVLPTDDHHVHGTVVFTRADHGIRIRADFAGLTPGHHGIQILEHGDCRALDAGSAGGHFNPDNVSQGCPISLERHVVDLGNVTTNYSGATTYDRIDAVIALEGPNSVIGRSIVVYAEQDDCSAARNGGVRTPIACGVIGIAAPFD